jgi:hypothetical protein
VFNFREVIFGKEKGNENEDDDIDVTAIYGIVGMRDNTDRSKRTGHARPW